MKFELFICYFNELHEKLHESAQKGTMAQKVCKKYDNILK